MKKRHTEVQKNGAIKVVRESKYKFSDTERMITELQSKTKSENKAELVSEENAADSETSSEKQESNNKNNDFSNTLTDSFLFKKEKKI
jgi:hypothetical protein